MESKFITIKSPQNNKYSFIFESIKIIATQERPNLSFYIADYIKNNKTSIVELPKTTIDVFTDDIIEFIRDYCDVLYNFANDEENLKKEKDVLFAEVTTSYVDGNSFMNKILISAELLSFHDLAEDTTNYMGIMINMITDGINNFDKDINNVIDSITSYL